MHMYVRMYVSIVYTFWHSWSSVACSFWRVLGRRRQQVKLAQQAGLLGSDSGAGTSGGGKLWLGWWFQFQFFKAIQSLHGDCLHLLPLLLTLHRLLLQVHICRYVHSELVCLTADTTALGILQLNDHFGTRSEYSSIIHGCFMAWTCPTNRTHTYSLNCKFYSTGVHLASISNSFPLVIL